VPDRATRSLTCLGAALVCALSVLPLQAETRGGLPGGLPLDAETSDGSIRLIWPDAKPRIAGNAEISRRPLGETGIASWQVIAPAAGAVQFYRDDTATPGTAWEYRVRRIGRGVIDQGYWAGGTGLVTPDHRGTAVLVVAEGTDEAIAPRLDRFRDDLTGDGWHVVDLAVPSGRNLNPAQTLPLARSLKSEIRTAYLTRSAGDFAIILVGPVPLVQSGRIAPDGHEARAFGTDLFHADLDAEWPAREDGILVPSTIPGGRIEAMVGRIDFSRTAPRQPEKETAFLRAYFDRNHAWRHGEWGDLRDAYLGKPHHLFVEGEGLANIVGPANVTEGGHHDVGETRRWLFGVDFGDANGARYLTEHAARPTFAINFGSYKPSIERVNNAMAAIMAEPNQALAVAWGARPAWRLHAMAVGRTIGDAQIRTVNNGPDMPGRFDTTDYLPTGQYPMFHPVWGTLLGDPTLHAFPVLPPADLTLTRTTDKATLTWTASPEPGATYRLYRAGPDGIFMPLGPGTVDATTFTDPDPLPHARYMVRARVLKRIHAGSLFALSQGVFAQ
jgi:hypothetical protein